METLLATLGVAALVLMGRAEGRPARGGISRAEEALRARSQLMAAMSHELKTPLNSVIGFAELLADDPGLNDSQRGYARRISEGGHRLLAMIETLVDLARAEADQLELQIEPVDPEGIIQQAAGDRDAHLAERRVELELETGEPTAGLRADPRRLRQLVGCLIDGVLAASRQGDRIRFALSPGEDGGLRMSVSGSAEALTAHLTGEVLEVVGSELDPFTGQVPGAGPPLALARRLAELHGGRAWTRTASGGRPGGFVVELPREAKTGPGSAR